MPPDWSFYSCPVKDWNSRIGRCLRIRDSVWFGLKENERKEEEEEVITDGSRPAIVNTYFLENARFRPFVYNFVVLTTATRFRILSWLQLPANLSSSTVLCFQYHLFYFYFFLLHSVMIRFFSSSSCCCCWVDLSRLRYSTQRIMKNWVTAHKG